MNNAMLFLSLLLFSTLPHMVGAALSDHLSEEEFADPPALVRPRAMWCWLNGNVSLEHISHELAEMKDKGMGGADIWDVYAGWCFSKIDKDCIPAGPEFTNAVLGTVRFKDYLQSFDVGVAICRGPHVHYRAVGALVIDIQRHWILLMGLRWGQWNVWKR